MLRAHDIVDRYVVEGLLGRGGAASVYAVRHRLLGVRRALKVPHHPHPAMADRLLDEGRIQARLDPVHVVPVTDVIEVDGVPALVMPLVEGCALSELLAAARPEPAEVLALLAAIVDGVRTAHEAGVVHRDLKPANVLIELRRGRLVPRVSDFGVAKVLAHGPATTRVGTPRYAAPEQLVQGGLVDHRADLYALGLMWGELATGRVPENPSDLEGVPEGWRPAIEALLRPRPEDRTADATTLRAQLAALGADPEPLVRAGPLHAAVSRLRDASAVGGETYVSTSEPTGDTASGLPVERDAFVGRAGALRTLDERVVPGAWVTVAGPGGVGKSRLVLHHVRRATAWTGGRLWCVLDGARGAAAVTAAVAGALGIRVGGDPSGAVARALAARGPCLVVLDDADHAIDDLATLVPAWLEAAPAAAFVATSRRTAGAAGETVVSLDVLPADEAAHLFDVRASAVHAEWARGEKEQQAVQGLVAELDGLPLALELAAARVSVLSPTKLLSRIGERFRLLARAGATDRHATLRATLDASWALLDDAERATLSQLATFEGGFDVDACEEVVDLTAVPGAPWVIDVLEALVRHSLVRRPARDRFDLLTSVRAYARDHAGDLGPVEARHGRWAARVGTATDVPADEIGNLTVACRRAIARRDVPVMLGGLRGCWKIRAAIGPFSEAIALASACLEAVDAPAERAPVLAILGSAYRFHGDLDRAEAHSSAALALAEAPSRVGIPARNTLAAVAYGRGQLDEARVQFQTLVEETRALDGRPSAEALSSLGLVCMRLGDLDDAERHLDEAVAVAEAASGPTPAILSNRGLVAEARGRWSEARDWQVRAVEVARAAGDLKMEAVARSNLANALYTLGDVDGAVEHYRAAAAAHRQVGDRRSEAIPLSNLAVIAMARSDWDEAIRLSRRAIAIAEATHLPLLVPGFWRNLANAQAGAGDPAWAESIDRAVALATAAPEKASCLSARALLRLQAGDLDGAREDIDASEALGLEPSEAPHLFYARAWWLRAHGRHDEADAAVAEGDRAGGGLAGPHTRLAALRARVRRLSSSPS